MHLTRLLLPLSLVLTATALPGGASLSATPSASGNSLSTAKESKSSSPTNPSVSPHVKPSTTKTSASTKPSTASNGLRTDYASLCETRTRTSKMWKEFDMEGWIDYLSNLIPSGETSFLDYMKKNTPGVSDLYCKTGQACRLIETGDGCNTTPPMTNPQNWAIIYSIVHFQDFIMVLLKALENAQADFNTMNGYLLATFTSHNFKLAAETWKNSLASASATTLSAFLSLSKLRITGPVGDAISIAGAFASLAGAGAIYGTGFLGSLVTTTVQVVENQLQEAGQMDLWLTTIFQGMRNGLKKGADEAINGVIHQGDGQGMYYADQSGIVSAIKNGTFFESIPDDYTVNVEASTLKSIFAAAVSSLWVQEGVYLVNTTDCAMYAWDDYESLKIDKDDLTRVEYNGDIFFVVKHTKGQKPNQAYDKVPGIDKLGNVKLTIQEVIGASAWSLSKVGFNTSWPVDEAMHYLNEGDGPRDGLFMNIPLCQLGQMPKPSLDLFNGRGCLKTDIAQECHFKQYVNWGCSKQVQITNGVHQSFPIDLYDPNWS